MCKNTFVCTSDEGCPSDEWKLGNVVRQGGVTPGILINFNLNEVLTNICNPPLGCEVSDNIVKMLCYEGVVAFLTPTENVLQYMLDTVAPKLEKLFLKIYGEKACNIVFKHKSKRKSTTLTLQGQPLKQVGECVYLDVVFMDSLDCTSNVERSKLTFRKQHNSINKYLVILFKRPVPYF